MTRVIDIARVFIFLSSAVGAINTSVFSLGVVIYLVKPCVLILDLNGFDLCCVGMTASWRYATYGGSAIDVGQDRARL